MAPIAAPARGDGCRASCSDRSCGEVAVPMAGRGDRSPALARSGDGSGEEVPLPGLETGRTSRAPDPHDHVALLRCFPAEGGETGSACMDKGAPGPADLCGVRWRSPPAAADTPVLVSWLARAG